MPTQEERNKFITLMTDYIYGLNNPVMDCIADVDDLKIRMKDIEVGLWADIRAEMDDRIAAARTSDQAMWLSLCRSLANVFTEHMKNGEPEISDGEFLAVLEGV